VGSNPAAPMSEIPPHRQSAGDRSTSKIGPADQRQIKWLDPRTPGTQTYAKLVTTRGEELG
jgi:hypothetical protein